MVQNSLSVCFKFRNHKILAQNLPYLFSP